MTFILRTKKSKEDMEFFNQLEYESYKSTLQDQELSEEEVRKKYMEFLKADPLDPEGPDHHIIIAENEEGRKCGLIWICNRNPFWRFKEQHLWIYNLHVIPEYRCNGLAQILMTKAEDWAQQQELHVVALHVLDSNKIARHIYEKMGYKLIETHNESCFYEKNFFL